jgi:hypothetical protein
MPIPEEPRDKFHRLVDPEGETQAEPPAEEYTPGSGTRPVRHPAVDENGMPLPRHVEEIDMGATHVKPKNSIAPTIHPTQPTFQ